MFQQFSLICGLFVNLLTHNSALTHSIHMIQHRNVSYSDPHVAITCPSPSNLLQLNEI